MAEGISDYREKLGNYRGFYRIGTLMAHSNVLEYVIAFSLVSGSSADDHEPVLAHIINNVPACLVYSMSL